MRKSFSLVEILVVVTIISLLASIAAVSYSRFVKQSRDTRRKTDIEQIRAAIEFYRNFNSVYPPSLIFDGTGTVVDPLPGTSIYMSKVPNDPMFASSTLNTYYYLSSAPFQDYKLCAYLEGGGKNDGATTCGASSLKCNYCMGPYGQK